MYRRRYDASTVPQVLWYKGPLLGRRVLLYQYLVSLSKWFYKDLLFRDWKLAPPLPPHTPAGLGCVLEGTKDSALPGKTNFNIASVPSNLRRYREIHIVIVKSASLSWNLCLYRETCVVIKRSTSLSLNLRRHRKICVFIVKPASLSRDPHRYR